MKKILNFKTLALTALVFGAFGCQQDEYEIDHLVDYVGTVQDNSTKGAISKEVTITYDGLKTPIKVEADGTFLIPNLKSGIYEFRFEAEGYATASYKTTVKWEADYGQLTSPKKGAHVNQLQTAESVPLYPSGAELAGYVFHAANALGTNAPYGSDVTVVFVPNLPSNIDGYGFPTLYTAPTNANGSYRITNLPKNVSGRLVVYSSADPSTGLLASTRAETNEGINSYNITENPAETPSLTVVSTNFEGQILAPDAQLLITFDQPLEPLDAFQDKLSINLLYGYWGSDDNGHFNINKPVSLAQADDTKTLVINLADFIKLEEEKIPDSYLLEVKLKISDDADLYKTYTFYIQVGPPSPAGFQIFFQQETAKKRLSIWTVSFF
ncbi:MAG: hypothetical protein EZS28_039642 [Streblomastix strix]|uniref:Carboxypeptidase regulatory-like domain-containing protein n=1 Tax=Streblomastix strix TaxID=222440 RepID=A0A5J4U3X0_9EUKA|nr:MAG: hypothetical protein EZS28_039642 [Streblomastix strix]